MIKAELEAALRAGGHEPEVREALVAAVEECDRLAQLAEDLLVLARAARAGCRCDREPLDVRELLDGVRAALRRPRARARPRDRRRRRRRGCGCDADALRLRQALGNLVDNALRHGAGDDRAARRARGTAASALEVADEGPGFPPASPAAPSSASPAATRARTRGGTGLGLAIVRAIAEAHGGRAEIVRGPGAAVRITAARSAASGPSQRPA